jgi:CheY-like chemotaxis protein
MAAFAIALSVLSTGVLAMKAALIILVVEDEPTIQQVLEDSLVEAGFVVSKAFSGKEAIEMLDAPGAHFRALITDVDLKSTVTGWDVARHARQIAPELPVIYATATLHEWESMGVPNSILIAKPYAPAQVVTAVSQLLNAAPSAQT